MGWDEDDDNLVDRETRKHILNLRKQIDEDERNLFIESRTDPNVEIGREQATLYWSMSVRQYLRGIKRLWGNDRSQIKNADVYWEEYGEDGLGEMTLVPPDTEDYQFSLVGSDADHGAIKRELGLPASAELPQPRKRYFRGLADVLYTEAVSHTWTVTVDPRNHKTVSVQTARPITKAILEEAIEVADEFLQQSGLGFEITPTEIGVDEDEPI